jgi:hypothetical protein
MRSNKNHTLHCSLALTAGLLIVAFAPAAHADTTRQWSTYYGGASFERGSAVQFDSDDNVIVAGKTSSSAGIAGNAAGFTSHDTTFGGVHDGFVGKLDFNGARLWGTYYGGAGEDYFTALATSGGDAIVAFGSTQSTGIATTGAAKTTLGGTKDGLLARFTASGALAWATYVGGSGVEEGLGVCVGSTGTIYVVGSRTVSGTTNGFLAKVTSTGANVLWTTHIGGASGTTIARGCVVDPQHNVYVVGETTASGLGSGASVHDSSYNAGTDAFLAKFTTNGDQTWWTYYGGTSQDKGNAITIDPTGNVYIVGHTRSSNGGGAAYIATPGAWSGALGDVEDAFVAKFNTHGARLWGTYFGDTGYMGEVNTEYFSSIAHDNGVLYLAGSTNSSAIATLDGHDQTYGGYQDAMFVTMDASDSDVYYATYIGGTGSQPSDQGLAVAATYAHGVVVGSTTSTAEFATAGAHDEIYNGGIDAYIMLFRMFAT